MFTKFQNGAEVEVEEVYKYLNGAEQEAEAVYAYKSGAEVEVWSNGTKVTPVFPNSYHTRTDNGDGTLTYTILNVPITATSAFEFSVDAQEINTSDNLYELSLQVISSSMVSGASNKTYACTINVLRKYQSGEENVYSIKTGELYELEWWGDHSVTDSNLSKIGIRLVPQSELYGEYISAIDVKVVISETITINGKKYKLQ